MGRGAMRAAVLAILVAACLAGCGGDSPEGAVEAYFAAQADGDGEEACSLLTEDGLEELHDGDLAACEEEVAGASEEERAEAADANIEVTEESESEATVEVTQGGEPFSYDVVNVDGEWQIDGSAIADVTI